MLWRRRTDFWGQGPAWREAGGFSFHRLKANEPEDEVEPHGHEEAHFVLVLSGGYMSSAAGAPIVSATPILIYNPPGTEHRDRFLDGKGSFLAISGGRDEAEMSAVCLRDPYSLHIARRLAFSVEDEGRFSLEAHALQLHASVQAPCSDESRLSHLPPSWLKRAVEMIFTSDDPNLSVGLVASEAGVHPVHLARVFKTYLGCTPGEYLRGYRLERAAAMIGAGVASLAGSAHDAGFVDQAHMTRSFRRQFETTPRTWANRHNVAPIQDALFDPS